MSNEEVNTISREELREKLDRGGAINSTLNEIGRAEEEIPDTETGITVYRMDPSREKSERRPGAVGHGLHGRRRLRRRQAGPYRHEIPYEGTNSEQED